MLSTHVKRQYTSMFVCTLRVHITLSGTVTVWDRAASISQRNVSEHDAAGGAEQQLCDVDIVRVRSQWLPASVPQRRHQERK